MRAGWVFVPVACVVGILIGSWRPRAQVRDLTRQLEESRKGTSKQRADSPEGFDTFTRMVRIPDEAGKKPRFASNKRLFTGTATNSTDASAVAQAEAGGATNAEESASANAEPAEPRRRGRPQRLAPEDLRARIAEAQELWSARVDLARAQWLDRLGMSDEASARVFDDAVNGMNDRLHALAQELADEVASGRRRVDHASGARFISEVSGVMADTYEAISADLPEDKVAETGKMQLTDFIDPAVAEPFIQIQAQFDEGFAEEGR
ncbi:MAG: hypothetical protein IJK04_01625 [Kiritimatiellae bacterium]|nr:hypothetical protein [Kiritimatiellia bacterium]